MPGPAGHFERRRMSPAQYFKLYVFIGLLLIGFQNIANNIWDSDSGRVIIILGVLGTWRYLWWFTHFVRSLIYAKLHYPKLRSRAEDLWDSGWRPNGLIYMMTTFHEKRDITDKVVRSIVQETRDIGVPAKLFVGTGHHSDERLITSIMSRHAPNDDIEVIFVRQNQPGKRVAIGLALRAISRRGLAGDTPVVFMDGDSILAPGCLRRCLPHFHLDKGMHALTTDEMGVVRGPKWMQRWLDLRFAQRHLAMQSHALAGRVLTLTGRMSIFRASRVLRPEFVEMIEKDQLSHWLWGRFRFLSGDDKSTWYALLKEGSRMLYIPDALVWTIDVVEGDPKDRAIQNLLRWSGNMLRNGSRAIALGPRRVGLFIWWCIVDQRIAMWTSLCGPLAMLSAGFAISPVFFSSYILWVLSTRLILSMFLFYYAKRVDLSFPFILYANQLVAAAVKIYILFRLPMQRWANRKDQHLNFEETLKWRLKHLFASYLTLVYVLCLFFAVLVYIGILHPPSWDFIKLTLGI
ncbi:glycosyltransferase [Desulfovibrio oxyclinae]|uniref:glycosyltransferase n=1 Tax=Desulfovibrio oxyclinae TaxID=63560 RepID=UPI000375F19C|nr:glycosyltransferase [Desulfovibrio oxyclinae]